MQVLPGKTRLRNDLLHVCVKWDVKLHSLTQRNDIRPINTSASKPLGMVVNVSGPEYNVLTLSLMRKFDSPILLN